VPQIRKGMMQRTARESFQEMVNISIMAKTAEAEARRNIEKF
jgi:hypothetical protein